MLMKAATVVSGSVVQGFGGIGIGLAKKCTVLLDITSTGLAPRRVSTGIGDVLAGSDRLWSPTLLVSH